MLGGQDDSGTEHVEIYKAIWDNEGKIQKWNLVNEPLPSSLSLHKVVIDQNTLYVIGGEKTDGTLNSQVHAINIDPVTCDLVGSWSATEFPGGGIRRHAVTSRFAELYVLGGQTATDYTNAVWYGELANHDPLLSDLSLHKTAKMAGEFGYGKYITYTLAYQNAWENPAGLDIVITDTLPVSSSFISASDGIVPAAGILTWTRHITPTPTEAVTFAVKIDAPNLDWEDPGVVMTYTPKLIHTMTLMQNAVITYKISYTSTQVALDGVIVNMILPPQLFPTRIYPATEDAAVAFQPNSRTVSWRVPGPISKPGQLEVALCVQEAFSSTTALPYTVTVQDVISTHRYTDSLALHKTVTATVDKSCTPDATVNLAWPETVPELYPTVIITNQAWLSSTMLSASVPSNIVNLHYLPLKIYLPLIMRQ